MIFNKLPMFHLNKRTNKQTYIRPTTTVLMFFFLFSVANAGSVIDKNYLRIEKNNSSETNDLEVTSIGQLGFKKDMIGHVDLSRLQSDKNGDGLALEIGGAYVFNWYASPFIGLGISLGYNSDNDDYIAAYYPEAGIVIDITNKFGFIVSTKRYHHLYDNNEAIIMMGLLFRN